MSLENNIEESLQDFSPTFIKANETIDKGIDYQHFYISTLIWRYHHETEDFCISSKNKDFGSFGDVVVEVKDKNKFKKETYALNFQISSSKNILKIKDLTHKDGNFNVKKYVEEANFEEGTKKILYTNATFSASNGQKVVLDCDTCILIWEEFTDWHLANGMYGYRIEVRKSVDVALGTIYLYCGQRNMKELGEHSLEMFKTRLNTDDCIHDRFVDFIYNWSKIEGKKEKLTKRVLKRVATLLSLSPFIKSLSFSPIPVGKNVKLLREAMSKFDVTVVTDDSCDYIKSFWRDSKNALFANLKKANRVRIRYQIMPAPIRTMEDLDGKDEETSKLLWLMAKTPLLVYGNEKTFDAMYLHIEDKYVVMGSQTRFYYCKKFHKLSDLEVEPEIYEEVLKNFKCLTSNGKEVRLRDLVEENGGMKDVVTVDQLVRMVDGPVLIADLMGKVT